MTPTAVVTSCSAKGWEEYGRRFVETYTQFWPADIPLYLVSEDELPQQRKPVTLLSLRLSQTATEFMERHRDNMRAHGRVHEFADQGRKKPKTTAGNYNFRYDAFRFSKKVFAIDFVARTLCHGGRLFWVDADVMTFAPVEHQLLERLLPSDRALSCLDRGEYHSECGFVGYNLDHPETRPFISAFADLYASDAVFAVDDAGRLIVQEWHDSWVFDWLRRRRQTPTYPIPHRSRSHPFANSELGRVADHKKGDRKRYGRTPFEQLVVNRDVRYYRRLAPATEEGR